MILKGNQRAGAAQLANHLMNMEDNDHVELHELRGFVSDTLHGAFKEVQAVSRGTRCKQFLFSLSLNPPEKERVPIDSFEQAIANIETKLGLKNQPRAIVFHEKAGRRHAHCVWSRINSTEIKAINLSHFKMKLRDISRELYLEQGWKIPQGLTNSEKRNPLNFTLAEWQQAKRAKVDPKKIKRDLQECWAASDNAQAFSRALENRGYALARGDKRGYVAVDWQGEVFGIARWTGQKTKEVQARLGDHQKLPGVVHAQAMLAKRANDQLTKLLQKKRQVQATAEEKFVNSRQDLVARQRHERTELQSKHKNERIRLASAQQARLPQGMKALWWRVTGMLSIVRAEMEAEKKVEQARHQQCLDELIQRQLIELHQLQRERSAANWNTQLIKDLKLFHEC